MIFYRVTSIDYNGDQERDVTFHKTQKEAVAEFDAFMNTYGDDEGSFSITVEKVQPSFKDALSLLNRKYIDVVKVIREES